MADYKLKFTAAEIDEKLDSIDNKQDKTLIVTADLGDMLDEDGTSYSLNNLSHSMEQISDAYNSGSDITLLVEQGMRLCLAQITGNSVIFQTAHSAVLYTAEISSDGGTINIYAIGSYEAIVALYDEKQKKITGTEGQIVGFDNKGNAVAQDMPIDTTLSVEGQPADAKAVGDAIASIPQSDWDINDESNPAFIKNRPFYVGDETAIEIFPYQNVTFDSAGDNLCVFQGGVGTIEPFEIGKTYYVTIDGTEYTCIAKDGSEIEQDGLVYLGDSSVAMDGIAGEYPFMAYTMLYQGVRILMVAYITSTTEHSIGISVFDKEIIKIPEKYMPDLPTITNIIFNAEEIDEDSGTLTNISCNKTYDEIYKWCTNMLAKNANDKEIFSDNEETAVWLNITGRLLRAHYIEFDGDPVFYFIDNSDPNMIVTTQYGIVYSGEDDLVGVKKTINLYEVAGVVAESSMRTKQDKITGTAGDFVVIGEDGNVTTKTIPYAEEATF